MAEAANPDGIIAIVLIIASAIAIIFWYRGRKLEKQITELKAGRFPTTRRHKLLVALGLRKKKYKPPHGTFRKGDVNIRVYRTCGKRRNKKGCNSFDKKRRKN